MVGNRYGRTPVEWQHLEVLAAALKTTPEGLIADGLQYRQQLPVGPREPEDIAAVEAAFTQRRWLRMQWPFDARAHVA